MGAEIEYLSYEKSMLLFCPHIFWVYYFGLSQCVLNFFLINNSDLYCTWKLDYFHGFRWRKIAGLIKQTGISCGSRKSLDTFLANNYVAWLDKYLSCFYHPTLSKIIHFFLQYKCAVQITVQRGKSLTSWWAVKSSFMLKVIFKLTMYNIHMQWIFLLTKFLSNYPLDKVSFRQMFAP